MRHSPQGNLDRIIASIRDAKAAGCTFRTGPELEVTGYGCEDSFHELDTYTHAWEQLCKLLATDATDGILCDIGMPVMHRYVPPTPRADWCAVCISAGRRAGALRTTAESSASTVASSASAQSSASPTTVHA